VFEGNLLPLRRTCERRPNARKPGRAPAAGAARLRETLRRALPRLGYARPPQPRSVLLSPVPSHAPDGSESSDGAGRPTGRPVWLLLAGAALGLGLAAFGLLESPGSQSELPPQAVARVGERVLRRVDYERVLAGVEQDLRGPVDAAMRQRVLERMIDEELLVQRALDLGLATVDRRIRGELSSALIDSIVSGAEAEEPDARAIEAHFEANRDFFTRPGRLRARSLFFSSRSDRALGEAAGEPRAAALERAHRAAARLARNEPLEDVRRALADPQISPLPDVPLPASKVRDYVGPRLLEAIEALEVGAWSDPIESETGFHLVQLVDREPAVVPPLEEVQALVRQDLERRRGDEALRRYLDELRARIPVAVDESLLHDADASLSDAR